MTPANVADLVQESCYVKFIQVSQNIPKPKFQSYRLRLENDKEAKFESSRSIPTIGGNYGKTVMIHQCQMEWVGDVRSTGHDCSIDLAVALSEVSPPLWTLFNRLRLLGFLPALMYRDDGD